MNTDDTKKEKEREEAVFAAGCFWGVEAAFREVPGVEDVEVGYTGGNKDNPTYEEVCTDTTGHAEAVRVTFDPSVVTYRELVEKFFTLHDPTQLDGQGLDIGRQYRSAIFFKNDAQKRIAEEVLDVCAERGTYGERDIVTEIVPAGPFYRAEEYHQRYFEKRGGGVCH